MNLLGSQLPLLSCLFGIVLAVVGGVLFYTGFVYGSILLDLGMGSFLVAIVSGLSTYYNGVPEGSFLRFVIWFVASLAALAFALFYLMVGISF